MKREPKIENKERGWGKERYKVKNMGKDADKICLDVRRRQSDWQSERRQEKGTDGLAFSYRGRLSK